MTQFSESVFSHGLFISLVDIVFYSKLSAIFFVPKQRSKMGILSQ